MSNAKQDLDQVHEVIGVGIGPFNLGLAALLQPHKEASALFLDRSPAFAWHPGMLLPDTCLQVPFLADLVTLADPTSPFSYLNYLHVKQRLFRYYFYENFHVPRLEYDDYCRWVSERLSSCRFGETVRRIRFNERDSLFQVEVEDGRIFRAKNISVGSGTSPWIPACFRSLQSEQVIHTSQFRDAQPRFAELADVAVIGSGQSAAEAFLALASQKKPGQKVHWLTRSDGFQPMEYSKLGLSQFFGPEFMRFFHGLNQTVKDDLLPRQGLLYKGISAATIAKIYDLLYEQTIAGQSQELYLYPCQDVTSCQMVNGRLKLSAKHTWNGETRAVTVDGVVLGTGYHYARTAFLAELPLTLDEKERLIVSEDHRIRWQHEEKANIFAQNIEFHSHGVGTPDLGLGAYRNARIVNQLLRREVYSVPEQGGFHSFQLPEESTF